MVNNIEQLHNTQLGMQRRMDSVDPHPCLKVPGMKEWVDQQVIATAFMLNAAKGQLAGSVKGTHRHIHFDKPKYLDFEKLKISEVQKPKPKFPFEEDEM
jgi:hypothetical protein